jgi:uncharacterized protein YrrD
VLLREGTPVYDRSGVRIGVVEQVVGDTARDIFDGLVIHTEPLPGGHLFASAAQIAELHERGVLLTAQREDLSPPRGERARDDQREPADGWLRALVRRTWDRLGAAEAQRSRRRR